MRGRLNSLVDLEDPVEAGLASAREEEAEGHDEAGERAEPLGEGPAVVRDEERDEHDDDERRRRVARDEADAHEEPAAQLADPRERRHQDRERQVEFSLGRGAEHDGGLLEARAAPGAENLAHAGVDEDRRQRETDQERSVLLHSAEDLTEHAGPQSHYGAWKDGFKVAFSEP